MFAQDFAAAAARAVNAHDPEAVVALWAEPADYHSALSGTEHGLDALRAREAALFAAFPDLRAIITVIADSGRRATVGVHLEGTHEGSYVGIPPSGRPVVLDMTAEVTFDDDGKVVAEHVGVDAAHLAATLRP
ncbi:steroid delta-isomerase-like uncharacterized protein [Mycobacterium sp. BK558]|nr:steroid delta-isomerase-like uncharacterized protein [Mycobacterium sp. BK558]